MTTSNCFAANFRGLRGFTRILPGEKQKQKDFWISFCDPGFTPPPVRAFPQFPR
jgi:hypothetical protein